MNQQFDLQNITDAVLKAVKSTGQEENVSAENIAKQVAEILKNNNTKINTFDSFDTDSLNNEKKFVEEEPKPLSGSFTSCALTLRFRFRRELIYFITNILLCQHFFQTFFNLLNRIFTFTVKEIRNKSFLQL
ncbi:unknown [Clostridium sp. CAG:964]|nr:unknown [Clostridium sp. CAG:964]